MAIEPGLWEQQPKRTWRSRLIPFLAGAAVAGVVVAGLRLLGISID